VKSAAVLPISVMQQLAALGNHCNRGGIYITDYYCSTSTPAKSLLTPETEPTQAHPTHQSIPSVLLHQCLMLPACRYAQWSGSSFDSSASRYAFL